MPENKSDIGAAGSSCSKPENWDRIAGVMARMLRSSTAKGQ